LTEFQEVYDAFFIKEAKNFMGKESQVYQFLVTAISKSRKTTPTNLDYVLISEDTYSGYFLNTLNQDDIELLALNMSLESKRSRKSELDYTKQHMGTKDFNRLPDKKAEYEIIQKSIKDLQDEILSFRQEFYSYRS
jgi:hypothetical protein